MTSPFIHRSLWPAGGLIVAILHVSKVCAAVALLCTVQESSIRGRRAAVKSEGQGYLERGRAC